MKTRIQPGMRKTLEIIALILTITFLIYGVNPKEDGKAYGFKAFAYTVTCSIQSITEGTNPQYQYASAPYEYYNTIAGGTFTVNVVASTNDPNGISSVSFPSTVSTGGSDTSYPYSWTYTWTTSSTYSSSATITCYSYWGSTGTTTLYVYRDITAPTLTFYYPTPANNTYTPNNYTQINITIVESGAGLDSFKFNWNGTNYTFYDDSLVLALNFNNNSAIGDSATTAVDISKYGNNGTMYDANTSNADGNRPPQYTTGRFGKGITFDGVDDWVMIPHSTSLQITTFPITIEAWVYINTTQLGGGTAFVQKGPGTWAQKNYFLGIMNNSAMLSVAYGDGAGWDEFRTTDFPKNQWVHVVGIIKGNDNLELYVNGQNKSGFLAYTSATSTPYATTDTLKIGTLTNSSYFFNGSIDEVRIYKRALSPQEILMHYQSEFAKYSSTEWRFYNNITNLTQGTYSYYGWANDSVANAGQSETRIITIDNVKPAISFQGQTDANGTFTYKNWSFVNVSISDAYNTTGLIDWNSSLVGWWRFNQESEENSTFFKDWSIYGNNATCSGTSCPNITTAGKFGSALTFDGIDDYITVPTDKSLNITNAITLEAWINLAATPTTTQMIIEKGNLAADSVYWLYVTSSGTLKGGVNISGWKEVSDGGSVSPNSWHHVAMVYNGSAVRLWLDGTPTGSALSATGNIGVNNLNLIIGKYSTYYLKGTIDEVRIYNRALSAEEIATSYNAGIYRLYHNFTLLPTGTYTYIAYAQDLAGNVNQTEMRTLIVGSDTTAPTTSISNITKSDSSSYIIGTWTSLNVSVNGFNCTDALSGCLATHACGDWTNSCTPSSLSTPILFQCAAGSVCVGYVRYNSTDNAFNVETTKSSTIYIDAQAPTTTINPNGQACNNSNVSVTLSCSDGSGSGCSSTWYKIVDSGTACDISGMSLYSSQFLVGCPPGSYCAKKICTYSIDNVSNAESLKSSNIYYIDFAGPNAPTGLLPSSGNCNGSSTPTLSWSAPSDVGCSSVAGYQVEIYSTSDCSGTALQTGTPSSNSWTPSALSTGTYSWRVKAKDVYNNWGSWSSCSVLSIDVSPPTPNPATISSTTPISSSQINITATTATDTGCSATVYYQINRTSPTTASSGWQTSPTWADTGLNCNTQYCYTAQTRDSLNNIGTASATSCTYTLVNGPSAPTVTPTSTTSLNVSWTAVCAYNNPQYYANETSYNAGATDSGWTTAMSYIDSGLNCFSQYTYRVKARNNQSVETAYSSTTSRYPIEYVSTCAGTGPSGKCWTLTTCYYTGTGCPSSTTMCASPNTYCKGADSSTCNSGNIDTCCYNVACTSGGASGSTSTVVNTTLCTCAGGNCNSGFCYNSTSQTCYTGVSCTATGWTSTSTNAPPNTPASPSATPSCAGPNTIVNATATITDPNADAMKLQVCKDSACTQTLCNSTQVSSGSQASCQFVASTACTVTGTCTIYLRALENSADACGQIKTSAVINTTFTYDANAPFTNATAITNSSTIYTFNTWTKSLYVNVTLNCTDSGGGTCALTQYCTDTTNTCTPTTTYTAP
ncbi:MAG: LamG-like jellyroll fold domain-containing protein, partial [Candidatus Woesearchaeota archaeon]